MQIVSPDFQKYRFIQEITFWQGESSKALRVAGYGGGVGKDVPSPSECVHYGTPQTIRKPFLHAAQKVLIAG